MLFNTGRPEKRTRLLKTRFELLELEDESPHIFGPVIFDRYASQPDTEEFVILTLAHFAVWYEVDTQHETADNRVSKKGAAHPRSKLQIDMGWV